jgi:hypothetical protein
MNAITQTEHAVINAKEYPGTRQLCIICNQPTERCEEDALYDDNDEGPLCEQCYDNKFIKKGELK